MSTAPDDPGLIIIAEHTAVLGDVGAPGHALVVAVDRHGVQHLVLADVAALNDPDATVDLACASATHDQAGPMHPAWRARVQRAQRPDTKRPLRCGRLTQSGRACMMPVREPGAACGKHRASTSA